MGIVLNNWALSLKCDKRLRTPARCPFYLDTERIIMYELLTTVGPVAIVIAIIIWIFDDGGKKQKAELQEATRQSYENSLRIEFKNQARRHYGASKIKPTAEELDWMFTQLGVKEMEDFIAQLKNESVSVNP